MIKSWNIWELQCFLQLRVQFIIKSSEVDDTRPIFQVSGMWPISLLLIFDTLASDILLCHIIQHGLIFNDIISRCDEMSFLSFSIYQWTPLYKRCLRCVFLIISIASKAFLNHVKQVFHYNIVDSAFKYIIYIWCC